MVLTCTVGSVLCFHLSDADPYHFFSFSFTYNPVICPSEFINFSYYLPHSLQIFLCCSQQARLGPTAISALCCWKLQGTYLPHRVPLTLVSGERVHCYSCPHDRCSSPLWSCHLYHCHENYSVIDANPNFWYCSRVLEVHTVFLLKYSVGQP